MLFTVLWRGAAFISNGEPTPDGLDISEMKVSDPLELELALLCALCVDVSICVDVSACAEVNVCVKHDGKINEIHSEEVDVCVGTENGKHEGEIEKHSCEVKDIVIEEVLNIGDVEHIGGVVGNSSIA